MPDSRINPIPIPNEPPLTSVNESGADITGPAIIEEIDSTTIIHPDYRATIDEFGNLFLRRG